MMKRSTVSAALSRTGNSTTKRARWSIMERTHSHSTAAMERTYLHSIPAAEVDNDLSSTKSTDVSLKWPLNREIACRELGSVVCC